MWDSGRGYGDEGGGGGEVVMDDLGFCYELDYNACQRGS